MSYFVLRGLWILLVLSPALGCTSLQSMIVVLETRGIPSCVYYEGYLAAYTGGTGLGAVRGVVATGGVPIEKCIPYRPPVPDIRPE